MLKNILLVIGIIIFYILFSDVVVSQNLIPDDAIRIRVIPHSNNSYDQDIKNKVSYMLKENMYNKLNNIKDSSEAKKIIEKNIDNINTDISNLFDKEKYNQTFDVNFGLNYFPKKKYKGINYKEGYYESLVVTIGDGAGDNWWCVLFPPFCLIEAEEDTDIEYTTLVGEMLRK